MRDPLISDARIQIYVAVGPGDGGGGGGGIRIAGYGPMRWPMARPIIDSRRTLRTPRAISNFDWIPHLVKDLPGNGPTDSPIRKSAHAAQTLEWRRGAMRLYLRLRDNERGRKSIALCVRFPTYR